MSSAKEYHYDFNYSLNLEGGSFKALINNEQKQFLQSASQLTKYHLIKSKQIQQFYQLLIRQGTFLKLGKQLQELIELQFQLREKKNIKNMDKLYFLRQDLCDTIQDMNGMLSRQRDYYINIIILFIMIITVKANYKKYDFLLQKQAIFHFIHWQLKGQHSTNQFYTNLLSQIIEAKILKEYFQGKPLIPIQINYKKSLTFKQVQSSMNLRRESLSSSSFAQAFNKQNQQMNNSYKPSAKNFKKISHQHQQQDSLCIRSSFGSVLPLYD